MEKYYRLQKQNWFARQLEINMCEHLSIYRGDVLSIGTSYGTIETYKEITDVEEVTEATYFRFRRLVIAKLSQ